MFSPSDNAAVAIHRTRSRRVVVQHGAAVAQQNDMWVRLSHRSWWTYEGWMVRDFGQPNAIWLSRQFAGLHRRGQLARRHRGVRSRASSTSRPTAKRISWRRLDLESAQLAFPKELTLPLNQRKASVARLAGRTHHDQSPRRIGVNPSAASVRSCCSRIAIHSVAVRPVRREPSRSRGALSGRAEAR